MNKFEAIGIFLSISLFAIALSVIRFMGDSGGLSGVALAPESQRGTIIVASDNDGNSQLTGALRDSMTLKGDLTNLVIDDVRIGTGKEVKTGDTIMVDYIGSTQDGVQFDNSYVRGEPFTFTVGEGRVIEGWERGVVGMRVGGQRILVIPADLAYGDKQVGPIEANSTLVFAIELLSIK